MAAFLPMLFDHKPEHIPDNDHPVITGLAAEWPPLLIGSEQLGEYATRLYPAESKWLQTLLRINRQTGIDTRAMVELWDDPKWNSGEIPSMSDVDQAYRKYATPLAAKAARKALDDSNLSPKSITHMVTVTATNAGSPGFDLLVAKELNLSEKVERTLLSGVGCAGGLTALRTASSIAKAASFCGEEARILVIACEICSIQIRAELHAASTREEVEIGPALFGDGAAALMVCNSNALTEKIPRVYSLIDHRTRTNTSLSHEMTYSMTSNGFLLHLAKMVPAFAAKAVQKPFESLRQSRGLSAYLPDDFDWALHPGGIAIIKGIQESMNLSDQALESTNHIYRNRGNTSSVSVLAVLDHMRELQSGKRDVVACSFGPGMVVEMAMLRKL